MDDIVTESQNKWIEIVNNVKTQGAENVINHLTSPESFADAVRAFDFDVTKIMSNVFANRLHSRLTEDKIDCREMNRNGEHLLLGLISDVDCPDVTLAVGGKNIVSFSLKKDTPIPIVAGTHALKVVEYQQIWISNVTKDAKIHCLGVRLSDDANKTLGSPHVLKLEDKNILIETGMAKIVDSNESISGITEMSSIIF